MIRLIATLVSVALSFLLLGATGAVDAAPAGRVWLLGACLGFQFVAGLAFGDWMREMAARGGR